jgi:hypothetical protein
MRYSPLAVTVLPFSDGSGGLAETGDGAGWLSGGMSKFIGTTRLRYFSGIECSSVVKACVPESSVYV